jgi:GTP-binding protein HflX
MTTPEDSYDKLFDELLRESARAAADFDANESSYQEDSQQELVDRHALRRVKGFSTELQDISDAEYRQLQLERVVLVGVWTEGSAEMAENSLAELKALAETAGSEVLEGLIQRRDKADPATYIGSGKVIELRQLVVSTGADTVICDGELSPSQLRTLEEKLKVKVVDRVALILDIFAQHAKSKEGKAQVELAQIAYLLPRLRGWGDSLSRQVGGRAAGGAGIGGRGPGETKIETDRRRIRDKMARYLEIPNAKSADVTTYLLWLLRAIPTLVSHHFSTLLQALACSSKTHSLQPWIPRFANAKQLKDASIRSLTQLVLYATCLISLLMPLNQLLKKFPEQI